MPYIHISFSFRRCQVYLLLNVIELKIIDGYGLTVTASVFLKKLENSAVFQHLLEIVERLVIVEVDLTHKVEQPFALNVEGIVLAADSLAMLAGYISERPKVVTVARRPF